MIILSFSENQEDNKQGARLLEEYVINVKGLKAESKVRLYGNIGQLYSIAGDYSAALQYCWRGLEFLESSWFSKNMDAILQHRSTLFLYSFDCAI